MTEPNADAAAAANPAAGASPPPPAASPPPPPAASPPPPPAANGTSPPPPPVETSKPDGAAMKAYLTDKAKEVSLEGKSEADIAQLYADHKAKEGQAQSDFKVPDAYKDKGWAAKVKSLDDLFKQVDELDAMKGKKTIVPDLKTATPEEREAYYAQLRPKDASAYIIPDEINGFPTLPAVKEGVAKMFMEHGISETQGNAVIQAYTAIGKAQLEEQFSPEGMKQSMTTAFGKDWEQVTGKVRNTIKGMMTPEDQAMLDRMPNAYLGVLYRTLGNTVQRFGVKETDAHVNAGTGNAGGGQDINAVRALIRADITKLGYQPHTAELANALRQQLADTYKNDPRIPR